MSRLTTAAWPGVVLNLYKKSGTIGWIVDVLRVWADVHELPRVTHETGLKIEIEHAWNLLLTRNLLQYPAQTLKQQGVRSTPV